MTVRFVLGRSGTGKTRYCTQSIIEALLAQDSTPLILLVPEQASYQAEKAILADGRIAGYSRLNVLSFNRLGYMLLGRRMGLGALSRSGQEMAVQAILSGNTDKLPTLCSSGAQPGLASEICRSLTEFHRSELEPDDVAKLAVILASQPGMEMSSRKFTDLAAVYKLYREFLASRFLNPDMELSEARKAVPEANFLKGARLWIDGFAGFTRQEFELLVEVLKTVGEAEIALCLDPDSLDLTSCKRQDLDPVGLFYPTECTYADLLEAVGKCKLELAPPHILRQSRRFTSPALSHIETSMAGGTAPACPSGGYVRLLAGSTERAEAEFAAGEICRLTRTMGYRYRDIAVVAPDIGSYRHYIEAAFNDCRIPFFVDTPKPLSQHPVAELVMAALRAAVDGLRTNHVLTFLKSGLGPLRHEKVGLLENFCLAAGMDGSDWTSAKPWTVAAKGRQTFDITEVDALRKAALKPLVALCQALGGGRVTPAQFTAAVFALLDELHIAKALSAWDDQAQEHKRFFDRFVSLFDELAEVFGDSQLTVAEYQGVLRSALESTTLASIPPRLDQVLVGTIERSRHPDVKALMLVGCCQGQFPSPLHATTVLTDEDRQSAHEASLRLGETVETQLASHQYLTYIALTRASERLYLSWPLAGEQGKPTTPSDCVELLKGILPDLKEESIKADPASIACTGSEAQLADLVCSGLGADPDPGADNAAVLQAMLSVIEENDGLCGVSETLRKSLAYDNKASLDAAIAASAFEAETTSSVTKLSSFAACPYKHFAEYMLNLSPRQQFRFEPLDLGTFYHKVLDDLTKDVLARKRTFGTATEKELDAALDRAVEKELTGESFLASFRQRSRFNAFVIEQALDSLRQCVADIAELSRAGALRTVASELVFGFERGGLPPIQVQATEGKRLLLRGKIDRLDVAVVGDTAAAFVFDYKTSTRSIKWGDIYHGLDLQLPVYLLALEGVRFDGIGKLVPSGAFLFPVHAPLENMTIEEAAEGETQRSSRKANGMFDGSFCQMLDASGRLYNFYPKTDGDQYGYYKRSGALRPGDYQQLLSFVRSKLESLARQIVEGNIDSLPYRIGHKSPCADCDFAPLCRFDWQINDYNFLAPVGKEELLQDGGAR
jgi:ATP-dependent helicase/nuclease subunit B